MAINYKDNRRDICISVDPGYDGTKVCINGLLVQIPNNILDVTGRSGDFLTIGDKKASGYISSYYVKDKEYLVGELARKSINDRIAKTNELIMQTVNDSEQRFSTLDFEANIMTVIGIALIEYAKATMKNDWKPTYFIKESDDGTTYCLPEISRARILVGIALPNDYVENVWPDIKRFLTRHHNYEIETQEGRFKLDFTIEPGHAMPASQVICALLGAASDDNGEVIEDNPMLKNLPALVIDGGYKTVGIFMLTKAHQVSDAESNEEFAMGNVHKEVARILREEFDRKDIQAFSIPSIIENDNGKVICLDKKEGTIEVDINKMIADKEAETCNNLIEYLNEKFNNLLDVKELLVTGGTGAAYYKNICAYMNKNRGHLSDKIYLTDYKFFGKQIDPVFAITIGMYKTLKHQLNKAIAKDDSERKSQQSQDNKNNNHNNNNSK